MAWGKGEKQSSRALRWEREICILRNIRTVWPKGVGSRQEHREMRVKSRWGQIVEGLLTLVKLTFEGLTARQRT